MSANVITLRRKAKQLVENTKGQQTLTEGQAFELLFQEECFRGQRTGELIKELFRKARHEEEKELAICMTKSSLNPKNNYLFAATDAVVRNKPLLLPLQPEIRPMLVELAKSLSEQERVLWFTPMFKAISESQSENRKTGSGDYPEELKSIEILFQTPEIAQAAAQSPIWVSGSTPAEFISGSLMGPFLDHETVNPIKRFPVIKGRLTDPTSLGPTTQHIYHNRVCAILKKSFLTKDPNQYPDLRSGALRLFEHVLNLHSDMRKEMPPDFEQLSFSSYTSVFTVFAVLLQLMEPLYGKTDAIAQLRPEYTISKSSRIVYASDEARVVADASFIKELLSEDDQKPFSASCEIFFLCLHALEVSLHSCIKQTEKKRQSFGRLFRLTEFAENIGDMARSLEERLNSDVRMLLSLETLQQIPSSFSISIVKFLEFTSKWLIETSQYDHKTATLPQEPPSSWKIIPEYILINLCTTSSWLGTSVMSSAFSEGLDFSNVLSYFSIFMSSDDSIRNPYTRALHIQAMHSLLRTSTDHRGAIQAAPRDQVIKLLTQQLEDSDSCCKLLIPSIMKSYVDLESLGGSNQFFEKFVYRYYTSVLIQHLYRQPIFRSVLLVCSKKTDVRFVKFFNMMLNDANWLLSEAVKKIRKIHVYEELQKQPEKWAAMSSPDRQSMEQSHNEASERCSEYMQLANEAVSLVHMLIKDTPNAFLDPALVDKLTCMLNFFLVELGSDVKQLRVNNREKHNFDHPKLLHQIIKSFVCLFNAEKSHLFETSVVEDTRSYSPEKFDEILQFVTEKSGTLTLDPTDVLQMQRAFARFKELHAAIDLSDIDFPDHLLDPIMTCPLLDPLKLPESGEWCERKVITQHLLNDNTNPFNRMPLTIERLEEFNETADVKAEADEIRLKVKKVLDEHKGK